MSPHPLGARALCEHTLPLASTCWVLVPCWVPQHEWHRVTCRSEPGCSEGTAARCPLPAARSPARGAQPLWRLGDDAPRSSGLLRCLISRVPDCPQGSPTLPTPRVKPRHLKCPRGSDWVGSGRAGLWGKGGCVRASGELSGLLRPGERVGRGGGHPRMAERAVCASTGWRAGCEPPAGRPRPPHPTPSLGEQSSREAPLPLSAAGSRPLGPGEGADLRGGTAGLGRAPRRWPVLGGRTGGLARWERAWAPRPSLSSHATALSRPRGLLLALGGSQGSWVPSLWNLRPA